MPKYLPSSMLSILGQAEFNSLMVMAAYREASKGELLLQEEGLNQTLFIIEFGGVQVTKMTEENEVEELARLGPGNFFGEMSVFNPGPVSATVRASKPTRLLVLERESLVAYLRQHPVTGLKFYSGLLKDLAHRLRNLNDFQLERLRYAAHLLKYNCNQDFTEARPVFQEIGTEGTGLLDSLDEKDQNMLLGMGERFMFQTEEEVVQHNQRRASLWFVKTGRVDVRLDSDGISETVGSIGPGGFFGEVSLFGPEVTAASVKASQPSEIVRFSRECVDRFSTMRPAGGAALYSTILAGLCSRILAVNERVGRSVYDLLI